MSRAPPHGDVPEHELDHRNAKLRFGTHSIPNYGALIWDSLHDIALNDRKLSDAFDALKPWYYKVENTVDRSKGRDVIFRGDGDVGPWTAEELEIDQEYLKAKRAYVKGLSSGLQRHDDPSGVLGGVLIESGVFDEVLAVHSEDLGVERKVQELYLSDAGLVAVTRIVRGGKATLLVCDGTGCSICAHAEEPKSTKEPLATAEQDHIPQLDTNIEEVGQQQLADRIDSAVPGEIDYGHTGIPLVPTGPRQPFNPTRPRLKRAGRGKRFAFNERFPNGQMRPVSTSLADLLGAALPPTETVADSAVQEGSAESPATGNTHTPPRMAPATALPAPTVLQRRPQSAMSTSNGGVQLRPQPNGLASAMPYRTHLPRIMQPLYRPSGMPPNMHTQRPGALKIAQTPYFPPPTNATPTSSRPSSAISILPPSARTIDVSAIRLTARKAALSALAPTFQTTSPVKIGGVASSACVTAAKKAVRSDEEALKLFISRKEAWERSLGGAAKGGAGKGATTVGSARVEGRAAENGNSGGCVEIAFEGDCGVVAQSDWKARGEQTLAADNSRPSDRAAIPLPASAPPTCTPATAASKATPRVALPLPLLRITKPDAPAKPAVNAVTASGTIQGAATGDLGAGGASAESVATSSNSSLPYSAPSSPPPVPQRARKKKPQGSGGKGRVVKKATRATAIATSGPSLTEIEEERRVTNEHSGSSSEPITDSTLDPTIAAQHVLDQAAILRQRFSDCAWLPDAERGVVMKKLDVELKDLESYAPGILEKLEQSSQSQLVKGSDEAERSISAAEDNEPLQGTGSVHRDEEQCEELRIFDDSHDVSRSASLTIRPYLGATRIPRPVKQTATTTITTASEEPSSREGTPVDDSADLCTPTTIEPHAPPAIIHAAPSASDTPIALPAEPHATSKSYLESLPINGSEFVEAKAFWDSKQPGISFDRPPSNVITAAPGSLHPRLIRSSEGREIAPATPKKEAPIPMPTLPPEQRATEHSFWDNLPSAEVFEQGRKGLTWKAQAALREGLMRRVLKLDSANDTSAIDYHPRTPDLGRDRKPATIRKADKRRIHGLNAEARIVRALKRAELTAEDGEAIRRSIDSITAPMEDAKPMINSSVEHTKKSSWFLPIPSPTLGGTSALRRFTVPKLRVPSNRPFGSSTAQRYALPSPDEYIAGQRECIDIRARSSQTKSQARARPYHPFFPSPCPVKRVQRKTEKITSVILKPASVLDGAPITATAGNAPLVIDRPFDTLQELVCNTASTGRPLSEDIAKIMAKWQHAAEKTSAMIRDEGSEAAQDNRCEAVTELDMTTSPSCPVADAPLPRRPDIELVTERSLHGINAMSERRGVQSRSEVESQDNTTISSIAQPQQKTRPRRDSLAMAQEQLTPLHRLVLGSEQSDDDIAARSAHIAASTVVDEAMAAESRSGHAQASILQSGETPLGMVIASSSGRLPPVPDATSAPRMHSTPDTPWSATAQTYPSCQGCSTATGPMASRMHSFWHAGLSASSALTSDFWGTNLVHDFEDDSVIVLPGEPTDASVIILRRLQATAMMIVLVVIAVIVKIASLQEPDPDGGSGPSRPLPGDLRRGR
ncbi:hypothetical protein LTR95_004557 [Oleoguttula sp. CCFEE 5521]